MSKPAKYLIRLYRIVIRPYFGENNCRFHPSCSEYALLCLDKYGFFKASYYIAKRILKCAPWHPGGIDLP